jgi:hypothetical protein
MERLNARELHYVLNALKAQCESRRERLASGTLDEDRTVEVEGDLRLYEGLVRVFEAEQAAEIRRAEAEAANYVTEQRP